MTRTTGLLAASQRAVLEHPRQLPPPDRDPEEVRQLAEEILDHPRYAPPSRSLIERVADWAFERIADLFSALTSGGGGSVIAWAVLLAAVALVVLVVVRAVGAPVLGAGRGEHAAPETMVELTRSPDEWRASSDELAGAGAWAEALVCRYRALVGDLVRAGVVADQPGRTAREHAGDVRQAAPPAAVAFGEATGLFEATWYGSRPAAANDLATMVDLERAALEAAGPFGGQHRVGGPIGGPGGPADPGVPAGVGPGGGGRR